MSPWIKRFDFWNLKWIEWQMKTRPQVKLINLTVASGEGVRLHPRRLPICQRKECRGTWNPSLCSYLGWKCSFTLCILSCGGEILPIADLSQTKSTELPNEEAKTIRSGGTSRRDEQDVALWASLTRDDETQHECSSLWNSLDLLDSMREIKDCNMRRDALQLTELSLRVPDSSLTACSSRAVQTPYPLRKACKPIGGWLDTVTF